MPWLVLSYSLPSTSRSSPRVALWRRLRRLGALPLAGAYVLPARASCLESFQWLAQEIRHTEGDTVLMRVEQFEGLTDAQVIDRFHETARKEYADLETQANGIEQMLAAASESDDRTAHQDALERLRRRYADIARVDYFDCPDGTRLAARLTRIGQLLAEPAAAAQVPAAAPAAYQGRRWVTRPRPHVDRLACAWLIRRFIDPTAPIRYAATPELDEIAFDMPDVAFGHHGSQCSFGPCFERLGSTTLGCGRWRRSSTRSTSTTIASLGPRSPGSPRFSRAGCGPT